jgi:hypothetical protein
MNRFHFFYLNLIFLLTFSESAPALTQKPGSSSKQQQYTVSGSITQTHSYCGGARPSPEMIALLNTPKAWAGKTLYIRSGAENSTKSKVLREIVADSAGHFSTSLPSGIYCIIEKEQVKHLNTEEFRKKKTANLMLDENCLKQWWTKCYMSFEVKDADKTDLNINFHIPCFTNGVPCMKYTGPLPQ